MIPVFPTEDFITSVDDEAKRIAALHALDLLDSEPEREFDAIVALAARTIGTPAAAINLVDIDRVWMKAKEGIGHDEELRELSFCTWTIRSDETMVIEDAAADRRMDARAEGMGGHNALFYAGVPIHAPSGERIGALCVADGEPRTLTGEQQQSLEQLASLVDALIAARATAREAIEIATASDRQSAHHQRQERILLQAQRMAMIGSWRLQLADDRIEWSDNVYRIHGLTVGEMPNLENALDFYPPHARAMVSDSLARTIETGTAFDIEVDFLTAQGTPRRVRSVGELEMEGGHPVAVIGVFQDITERHALEQTLRQSANTDDLTRLGNRAAFNRALSAAMARARAHGTTLVLVLIDLDQFKATNDTYGHLIGDDVLRAVGRRLQRPWLGDSFAARLGGDEFAVIVENEALCADPGRLIHHLTEDLSLPVRTDVGMVPCDGTAGYALFGPDVPTPRDLLQRADSMLYAAKRARQGDRREAS